VKKSRLHTVLRLRSLAERQARGRLAERERELAKAREMLEHRRQVPPPEAPADVLSPLQLRVLSMQGVRSHELLMEAAAEAERNRTARDEAQRHWSDATRELKSTERLEDRMRTQMADAARLAAERALDEMVVLRRGYAR
jgi:flagellar biosynthesis chaperone FliJ